MSSMSSSHDNQKRPPPLPDRFFDYYTAAPRIGDDPALHSGRSRQVGHHEGQWPVHVYVEWIVRDDDLMAELDNVVPPGCLSLVVSPLGAELPLHLSLSAPLVLASDHARDAFVDAVTAAVANAGAPASFTVTFSHAEWVTNSDRSRLFFTLRANQNPQLHTLLAACNQVCADSDLPTLPDAFHVSLAWKLPYKEPHEQADEFDRSAIDRLLPELAFQVDTVKLKVGKKVVRIALVPTL
ncbi:U6 snRNA phosphodiesterase Usb1 [Lipomyces japonicus]|uniref:U6 snRNA phosphodiesterase Usb1 n=1 Tax=Lipomyces japonicus TaxID=56871 RepID=UPI0034CE2B2F